VAGSKVNISNEVLDKTLKRWKDSWDYQSQHWHDKWDRDTKLYDSERVNAQYQGVTDTFVPMVFSTIETMVAALNNANLRFDYQSGNPMRQPSTAPLNALVEEWWNQDQWDLAMEEGYREMLTTGMSGGMLSWDVDHPHLESGAMRDYISDPTIRSPRQLQEPGSYAGRRYLARPESMQAVKVVDTDEKSKTYGQLIPRYSITEEALSSNAPEKDDDKSHKEMLAGSTIPGDKDQSEFIEIWDVDRVVTLMNRRFIVEDIENPYKARHRMRLRDMYIEQGIDEAEAKKRAERECEGLVPFFFLRNYRKISLFYARSEVDAIAKPQELLNDMTNMEADYIIRQLAPQKELDPAYSDWIDLITNDPDVVYPFKPGSLVDRAVPVLPANSFNNRMNIKNEMRETTAVDQLAKGIANVKDTTATEVNAQLSQTSQRIESKARIIEKDGLYWMAYIIFRMFQLFVDEPIVVQVKGADTTGLRTTIPDPQNPGTELPLPKGAVILDPKDYQGDWRPTVSLEVDATAKQAENQKVARENYQIIVQDPSNNLPEAKKALFPKMFAELDREEIDKIITPNPQAAMGMPGADPMAAGDPQGQPLPQDPSAGVPVPQDGAEGPTTPENVDTETLANALTPQELEQLRAAIAGGQTGA
jgi:hypothetical protein